MTRMMRMMNEQIKRLSYIKIFFILIRRKIEGNNAAKNRIVPKVFFYFNDPMC
jgi:hypothetical protein